MVPGTPTPTWFLGHPLLARPAGHPWAVREVPRDTHRPGGPWGTPTGWRITGHPLLGPLVEAPWEGPLRDTHWRRFPRHPLPVGPQVGLALAGVLSGGVLSGHPLVCGLEGGGRFPGDPLGRFLRHRLTVGTCDPALGTPTGHGPIPDIHGSPTLTGHPLRFTEHPLESGPQMGLGLTGGPTQGKPSGDPHWRFEGHPLVAAPRVGLAGRPGTPSRGRPRRD